MSAADPMAAVFEDMKQALSSGKRVWIVGSILFTANAPPKLAPPPHPEFGWLVAPYLINWDARAGAFLRRHAGQLGVVTIDSPPTNEYERVELTVAQGWRP
jgi:hypothetical protein